MSLSNRQRRLLRKRLPKVSNKPSVAGASRQNVVKLEQPADRDSLTRLHHRGVVTRREWRAGETYRKAFSSTAAEGVPIASGINPDATGGGSGARAGQPRVVTDLEARQTLFWLRWIVLGGQPDAVGVMDAVCGKGLSLAEISRGNDRIAGRLETALKIALGQCATALENKRKSDAPAQQQA